MKKIKEKIPKQPEDTIKIWCDDSGSFRYVKACLANCKKKQQCKAFRNYLEPRLF